MNSLLFPRLAAAVLCGACWLALLSSSANAQPEVDDPAVGTIVDSNPTAPGELAEAGDLLTRLGHPKIAERYLKRLVGMNLGEEQMALLVEQSGPDVFNRLRQYTNLPPEVGEFANRALQAARTARLAPERLAKLADQAIDGDETRRIVAIRELRSAGAVSVAPLLKMVASDDPQRSDAASAVLLLLGGDAIEPLIGALDTADNATKIQIYRVFGQSGARHVAPYILGDAVAAANDRVRAAAQTAVRRLLGSLPSARDAQIVLYQHSESLLDRSKLLDTDIEGNVTLWRWNPKTLELTPKLFSEEIAQATLALRTAKEAYAIDPANNSFRRQFVLASLQALKLQGGLDQPLTAAARRSYAWIRSLGYDLNESVLAQAMERNHIPAAIAAAEVLADLLTEDRKQERPGIDALSRGRSQPSPLVAALTSPDRRLRFAALQAIMASQPKGPFPGSSHVTDALGYFASSSGVPRVAVIDSRLRRGQQLASHFLANGYQVEAFKEPRDFLVASLAESDLAFALMELNSIPFGGDSLLSSFRRDYRTRNVPVGIVADPDQLLRARALAAIDPLTSVFVRPRDSEAAALRAEQLTALAGWRYVSDDVRREQARAALTYIAAEAERTERLFDVLRIERQIIAAFLTPSLAVETSAALGPLGTATSQRVLANVASETLRPEPIRAAAAAAFAKSVRQFGVLLDSKQVLAQYDRYNASEQLDEKTQQILGGLLDAIESGKQFPHAAAKPVVEDPAAVEP